MSAETDSQPLPLGWTKPLVTSSPTPSALRPPRFRPDAELVAATLARRAELGAVYDRYGEALFRFCLGLLRDPDDAADCVQEVFHTAATRLHQLRDPSALRAWLFAIARHEVTRRRRRDGREVASADVPDRADDAVGPAVRADRAELAELMGAASRGLPDRDRAALALHYHQDLDGTEIARALGLSVTATTTLLARARATFERSLAALVLARRARAGRSRCPELTALVARWDGTVTVLWRKRTARHIDACPTCIADRADAVNPRTLLGAVPLVIPTPRFLRAAALNHAAAAVPSRGTGAWWPPVARAGFFPGLSAGGLATVALAMAIPVAGLLAVGATPPAPPVGDGPSTTGATPSTAPPGGAGRPAPPSPRFGFDLPTFVVPPRSGATTAGSTPPPLGSAAPPAGSSGVVIPTTGPPPSHARVRPSSPPPPTRAPNAGPTGDPPGPGIYATVAPSTPPPPGN